MLGAFRSSQVLRDGRNRFSKVIRISQHQKRNSRQRIKIIQENAAIIREGKEALDRVNAKIIAAHRAEMGQAEQATVSTATTKSAESGTSFAKMNQ